ncbi:hypothetical protein D5S10_11835 [Pseudomonas savastanoi]|nr:hypothetical protein D5S10_11835 [Pseudomonas savastanoi]
MGVRLKRLKMVSTYIWVDTIASSDGVRKVCCPDGYERSTPLPSTAASVSSFVALRSQVVRSCRGNAVYYL